jgi:hypothetical protein
MIEKELLHYHVNSVLKCRTSLVYVYAQPKCPLQPKAAPGDVAKTADGAEAN